MILVTGGAGFIGSHLVARLALHGANVRVLDNFSSGRRENLEAVAETIDLVEGDIRDPAAVQRAVAGVRTVFHLAAEASVPRSVQDPQTTIDVNVSGTLNVLQAARAAGCERVVFSSTCAVYGDSTRSPKTEAMTPCPLTPYAVSKLAGEHLCAVQTHVHGLPTVALRYFNVFGPRQEPTSPYAAVIPRFLSALRTGAPPVVYGDGGQTRDFVYVEDVVDANLRAATVDGIDGRVFNVASGRATTINEVRKTLAWFVGRDVPVRHKAARLGDIRHSLADVGAAREDLGFEPRISFAEGMELLVAATPTTTTGRGVASRDGGPTPGRLAAA